MFAWAVWTQNACPAGSRASSSTCGTQLKSQCAALTLPPPQESPQTHPGPLEQALSAKEGDITDVSTTGQEGVVLQSKKSGVEASRGAMMSAQSMGRQESTAMTLTGRLGSLFPSRRSSVANYQQPEDDLSGSNYMSRQY